MNLGSPDAPNTPEVRKYLKEFLLDERVIDIPALQRNLLVRGIIAPTRAPKSAEVYKKIWSDKGAPLIWWTKETATMLQKTLGKEYEVVTAMRYQNPSLSKVLELIQGRNYKKLIVLTMYPQYASSTVGSVHQKVMDIIKNWQTIPPMSFINSYHDHPDLIRAFAERGKAQQPDEFDHVIFSFHGLPVRQLEKADMHAVCYKTESCCEQLTEKNYYCYRAQCYDTAKKIADELGMPADRYTVAFQSRLGKTPWIQPYTSDLLKEFAEKGVKRLLVFAPSFTSDCLETTFEIGEEYAEEFEELGGEKLQLVESLNTHPGWIKALEDLVRSEA